MKPICEYNVTKEAHITWRICQQMQFKWTRHQLKTKTQTCRQQQKKSTHTVQQKNQCHSFLITFSLLLWLVTTSWIHANLFTNSLSAVCILRPVCHNVLHVSDDMPVWHWCFVQGIKANAKRFTLSRLDYYPSSIILLVSVKYCTCANSSHSTHLYNTAPFILMTL